MKIEDRTKKAIWKKIIDADMCIELAEGYLEEYMDNLRELEELEKKYEEEWIQI